MKSRLTLKLRILIVSAYLVCTFALVECGSILWTAIKYPLSNIWPTLINIGLFAVFFTFSIVLIRIIKVYYPDAEIPRNTRIFFRVISIAAWICEGFFLIAIFALFAGSNWDPDFTTIFDNVITAIFFLSFLGAFVLQILNSILAAGLIRRISKNHRQQMFESI
ncbi:MAG TPA: hypothetical protein VJT83_00260 [Chitinophagaceae bacterium]|nr:hypothetical protein [Chitinophagaceae bacterium]